MRRLRDRAWPPSRIGVRLLAFNLLVVFVPVVGVLYLDVYESRLLQAQEREMVQQGRLLAAAAARDGVLRIEEVERILLRLDRQSEARFRVYDTRALLVADSSRIGRSAAAPLRATYGDSATAPIPGIRRRILYRLGAWLAGLRQRLADAAWEAVRPDEFRSGELADPVKAPELHAALEGRYGAATRPTPGQRSLTLFSAIPIRDGESVVGAVVVSQSTFRVLQAIYAVRLRIFEVVVASIVAAAVLTALAAMTIVRPLRRLRRQASDLTEQRGPLPASFPGAQRKDELGDLARALEELTRRVNEHIALLEGFAADVAHEFRNPLASIRTAAEMIAECEQQDDRERFLELMLRDVDRLERLVSGARDMARIDGDLEHGDRELVSVADVVHDAADRVPSVASVRVEVNPPSERILVRGSRERLTQVLDNLLSNAASFAPEGSGIDVTIATNGGHCSISVADRGPGIPEEHLERIFERFFTYRPASGRREHVGLGLAIARRIVTGYGGSISARSRAGGGALFEISLPVVSASTEQQAAGRI